MKNLIGMVHIMIIYSGFLRDFLDAFAFSVTWGEGGGVGGVGGAGSAEEGSTSDS